MRFDRNTLYWRPEDQDDILIKDLPIDHFINILNWINVKHRENYNNDTRRVFNDEMGIRKLLAFASNEPWPEIRHGEYMLVDEH